ncbi:threonine--tRNA ligase [Tessaracoccus sp. OH4464_COT-324]|uniref:threonine--tRNA ligase n=1 Tax=Tessaracoccus sp. OH4464_COT-324 TaxID=2491059 RepID=UPI000F64046A|nr:threonine--tRNA ligase [Tessaracoccus sp. OH4464_COT-324]RRD48029.1 threonine--tRNA ligase [Tessaracoccus sp. OH4464_COT-324]
MNASIVVNRPTGPERVELTTTTTGLDLFGDDRTIVAMKVAGETIDLARELRDGDEVTPVSVESDEGLAILRHSAGHVTAQALQEIFTEAKLGIGPPIVDGFYYDFQCDPLTPADLKAIEKKMQQIIKAKQRFVRREVSDDEARAELADEPFKLELIADKGSAGDADGASVEVGSGQLTIYDNVNRDGSVAWKDLCRGPHVPHTGYLQAVKLMRSSAAYWRGDQRNASLQRVYGTAWASKDDLNAYVTRLEEAAKRDHRKLGVELDLFSFPDEIGSGLAVFHPKGAMVRMEMEEYSRRRHVEEGYEFAYTPHLTKARLYEVSGHLDWYADGMYPPMHMDEERDERGNITKQGVDYYMKPMNCPMHNLIFAARGRSYRELPLRLFEFGTVYRNEKSGVVHGLTRARGFTQDDAHIYCTREQMRDELAFLLKFVLDLLADYGLDDFYLELSTKNPEKFVGDDATWEEATEVLRQVATDSGLSLVDDPGGAAFYGPKISVQAKDAIGRTWQMSTIQLDFNLPERFGLEYQAADGTRKRPVMIHRALFGSIERFFAVLTEHYAGAFPAWLAPVQVLGIPVAAEFNDYLGGVLDQLRRAGIRVALDASDDRFPKKIRNAQKEKVPFMLIAGGDDRDAQAVSFRFRDGSQRNGVPVAEAVAEIIEHVRSRSNSTPTAAQ